MVLEPDTVTDLDLDQKLGQVEPELEPYLEIDADTDPGSEAQTQS